jgi:hypothetical protein
MMLANMREQGVHHLIAFCLHDACRHQAMIDVSKYPGETPVPWFRTKVKCGKCGRSGRWVERPAKLERGAGNAGQLARAAGLGGIAVAHWRVDIIGKKLQHVGTVEAGNEREALAEAIKRFEIRPALRAKIAVTKVKE